MANSKKFVYVSTAAKWTENVDSILGVVETSDSARHGHSAADGTGEAKWFKSIVFRADTNEIYNRGVAYGLSTADALRITNLESLKSVCISGGLVTKATDDNGKETFTWALDATKVSYAKTVGTGDDAVTDKVIKNATDVQAAIKELDAAVSANKAAELTYKTRELTSDEVSALTNSANVLKAYKTVSVDADGAEVEQKGDTIVVYKDKNLKEADFVTTKPAVGTEGEDGYVAAKAGQFLKLTYILADGSESTVYIDMSQLVTESEVENGIQVVDGKLSIKVDDTNNEKDSSSETGSAFLVVTSAGIKLVGIKDEIDRKINALDLDKTSDDAKQTGTNVTVTISETDGKVKMESVEESYATVTRTATSDEGGASLTVKSGDEGKLVKASDLAAAVSYFEDVTGWEEL